MKKIDDARAGGYDDGYSKCSCFWGEEPGSLLKQFSSQLVIPGARTLDLGCGEGKNSAWLASQGAQVTAVDVSEQALDHARALWQTDDIQWVHADAMDFSIPESSFDIVIIYGLMHCLTEGEINLLVRRVQRGTSVGGWNFLVAFNDRSQDLSGHPGFNPTLVPHTQYLDFYAEWAIEAATDQDLFETHPHNEIPHHHSLTRLAARRIA